MNIEVLAKMRYYDMATIRVISTNLSIGDLFGKDFIEIEAECILLGNLLQELTRNSSLELDLFYHWRSKVCEEYALLLNRRNLRIQTTQ